MRTSALLSTGAVLLVAAVLACAWILRNTTPGGEPDTASAAAAPGPAPPGVAAPAAGLPEPLPQRPQAEVLAADDEPGSAAEARRFARLRGRVLDSDGVAVPGVMLSLYRGALRLQAASDATGAFDFTGLPSGLYRLFVETGSLPDGLLAPARSDAFRLTAGADRELELRLVAAATARGRVVGPGGEPLSGALVTARTVAGHARHARTDAAGRFELAGLLPAWYVTTVLLDPSRPEAATSGPLPRRFEIAPRQELLLDDLVAGASGCVLRGTVVDEAGQPVAGLPVTCREEREDGLGGAWSVQTDAAGRYALGRVPLATLVVQVGETARRDAPSPLREPAAPSRVEPGGPQETLDLPAIEVALRQLAVETP